MPEPHEGESESDFVERCMGDSEARAEFPDESQRAAVCHSKWRQRKVQEASELGWLVRKTGGQA